jgi:hypothetical protein
MRSTLAKTIAATAILVGSQAGANPIDDLKVVVTASKNRATEARDRAGEARDRSGETRDRAAEVRDRAQEVADRAAEVRDTARELRDGLRMRLELLSGEMRTAMLDAIEDLQRIRLEMTDGLDDFVADGGCSSAVCEPFRQNLLGLFQNMAALLDGLYDLAGMEGMHTEFQIPIQLIQDLPGRALFPLYRALGEDNNAMMEDLVDRMAQAVVDLQLLRDALNQERLQLSAGPYSQNYLDSEMLNCAWWDEHILLVRSASTGLTLLAVGVKPIGKILNAIAVTEVGIVAGVGFAEAHIKSNPLRTVGTLLESLADALFWGSKFVANKSRYCVEIVARGDVRDSIFDPGCEDDDPETECELQTNPDEPATWSLLSKLGKHPDDGLVRILDEHEQILQRQQIILQRVQQLKAGDMNLDGTVDGQDIQIFVDGLLQGG